MLERALSTPLIKRTHVNIYLFKDNNRHARKSCEICSKLTIKTFGVVIGNFGHISHLFLVFLLLTLNK